MCLTQPQDHADYKGQHLNVSCLFQSTLSFPAVASNNEAIICYVQDTVHNN